MQLLNVIAAPLVGGLVGYVTNYIAIQMLFHPAEPVMLGRFRVPFTPGIVPKRKDALAGILGKAIVEKFFNADDLEAVFTSEPFTNAFADSVVLLLTDNKTRLGTYADPPEAGHKQLCDNMKDALCVRIQAAVLRSDLSRLMAGELLRILQNRTGSSVLGKVLGEDVLARVTDPLAERLETFVLEEGHRIILPILDDELKELGGMTATELTADIFPDPAELHALACRLHRAFMSRYVRRIAESIDVGGMITEKVRLMSAREVEGLVLAVVRRELRYVVLLGALIGMLIGTINIFI